MYLAALALPVWIIASGNANAAQAARKQSYSSLIDRLIDPVQFTAESRTLSDLNTTLAALNVTESIGEIPKVDRFNFFTFVSGTNPEDAEDGGSYPLKVFFDSMQHRRNTSTYQDWWFDDMVIELGSTYQVCWQQTDGNWWA